MKYPWVNECEGLSESGNISAVYLVLERALDAAKDIEERCDIYRYSTDFSVRHFFHRKAIESSRNLESNLGIGSIGYFWMKVLGNWTCLKFLLGFDGPSLFLRWIVTRTKPHAISPNSDRNRLNAILYANYWYDIRRCSFISCLLLAAARDREDRLEAIGQLAYTLAYGGSSWLGLPVLRKVYRECHLSGYSALARTFAMHLVIAEQMAYRYDRASAVYSDFTKLYPDAPPFLRALLLANQITVAIGRSDLVGAEDSIDRCFSYSFALNRSRHLIQVYGYKALLLTLQGRATEAQQFIKRSLETAKSNECPLDLLIGHRIAALVSLAASDFRQARAHISSALSFSAEYGKPLWYELELRWALVFVDLKERGSRLKCLGSALRNLWRSCTHFSPLSVTSQASLFYQIFLHGRFWSESQIAHLLRWRIKQMHETSDYDVLRHIGEGVAHFLPGDDKGAEPTNQMLIEQVQKTFRNSKVVITRTLDEALGELRRIDSVEGFFSTVGDCVRVSCKSGIFIGLVAPRAPECLEPLTLGVLVPHLNTFTESLVESVIRILLANFIFVRSVNRTRDRRIADERSLTAGRVARQIAHDIRSPLAALSTVEYVSDNMAENERVLLRSAIKRINDIANDLLSREEARPEAEGEPLRVSEQCLSGLIDDLVLEKRAQFTDHSKIRIATSFGQDSFALFSKVDPSGFKRVLSNLINNAVEALDGEGEVQVGVFPEGENVVIRIEDTGRGIPEEIIPKLGMEEASYGKKFGFGLGLTHAREMAALWNGGLDIQSELGRGTVVDLRLPLVQAPVWFAAAIDLKSYESIVVIDDDPSIHQVWKTRLNPLVENGRSIFHFSSVETFEAWQQSTPVRATGFLVDYELLGRNRNGLDLIDSLNIGAHSFLVTSHYEEEKIRARCEKLGVRILPKRLTHIAPILHGGNQY